MTIPTPNGSGMGLMEFLELLRKAVNRSFELNGDDSIHVESFDGGRNLSFVGEGAQEQFFAKITGRGNIGDSGKRWAYSWEEVSIGFERVAGTVGDKDSDLLIPTGRTGTFEDGQTTYLINLAEINNTPGNTDIQGNGTELVAPLGGQSASDSTKIAHHRVVPVWITTRQDGSKLYWTDVSNSDNIRSNSTLSFPGFSDSSPAVDEDDPEDGATNSEVYSLNTSASLTQTGDADEGNKISLSAGVRINYNHLDTTPKLREFYRNLIFKPNGTLLGVSAETPLIIDDPEACS